MHYGRAARMRYSLVDDFVVAQILTIPEGSTPWVLND
jgi:hypothetical protein